MAAPTRNRDQHGTHKPVLCVTPDWMRQESCTFLAGHDGPCSFEIPKPKCGHDGCLDADGHFDGCVVDPYGDMGTW